MCVNTQKVSAPDTVSYHIYFDILLQGVLAAIIYVNLHGMMKQFMDIPLLWKKNRVDMVSVCLILKCTFHLIFYFFFLCMASF